MKVLRALWSLRRLTLPTLILVSIHSISALNQYGWSDDWTIYRESTSHSLHAIRDGRPLFAIILPLQFQLSEMNLRMLWIPRALGLFGIAMLYTLFVLNLRYALKLKSITWMTSFISLPVFLTLPFFWITSWATIASWSFAALSSGFAAYLLLTRSCESIKSHVFIAYFSMLISFLIYPLYSLFGLVLFVVNIILSSSNLSSVDVRKKLFLFVWIHFLAAVTWSLLIRFVTAYLDEELNDKITDRVQPHELFYKLFWLASRPLLISLTPFNFHSKISVALIHLIVMLVIFYLALRQKNDSGSSTKINKELLLTLFCILLSLWPLAISSSNQIDHRLLLVPTSIIMSILASNLALSTLDQRQVLQNKVPLVIVSLFICTGVFNQYYLSDKLLIKPFQESREFIRNQFGNCFIKGSIGGVWFYREYYRDYHQYIGNLSSKSDINHPWTLKPMIELVVRHDFGRDVTATYMGKLQPPQDVIEKRTTNDICFIDFNSLR